MNLFEPRHPQKQRKKHLAHIWVAWSSSTPCCLRIKYTLSHISFFRNLGWPFHPVFLRKTVIFFGSTLKLYHSEWWYAKIGCNICSAHQASGFSSLRLRAHVKRASWWCDLKWPKWQRDRNPVLVHKSREKKSIQSLEPHWFYRIMLFLLFFLGGEKGTRTCAVSSFVLLLIILSNLEYEGFGSLKCVCIHPSDYFFHSNPGSVLIIACAWNDIF